MDTRKGLKKERIDSAVDLAVAAVEDSGRSLDIDAGDPDCSPTSLGLPAVRESAPCKHRRWICADCGTRLYGDTP